MKTYGQEVMARFWKGVVIACVMVAVCLILVVLSGCQSPSSPAATQPTTPTTPTVKILKNSVWKTVTPSLSSRSLARDVTGSDLVAYVDDYNATHFDDFLRIYDGVDAPSLSDAPDVSVFICNPVTYAVNWSMENIPRQNLVDNATAWKHDAYGQLLFIDHVPPAPIITPPPPYEYYAIYEVNDVGGIVLETHCGYLPDESFDGQWIYDGGWSGPLQYFDQMQRAANLDVLGKPGWYVITRQLYTPPVVP